MLSQIIIKCKTYILNFELYIILSFIIFAVGDFTLHLLLLSTITPWKIQMYSEVLPDDHVTVNYSVTTLSSDYSKCCRIK